VVVVFTLVCLWVSGQEVGRRVTLSWGELYVEPVVLEEPMPPCCAMI